MKETFRSLLNRRAEDSPTLDRPLMMRFAFWLERDQTTVRARAEIAPGDDGLAALERIPGVLAQIAQRTGTERAAAT